MMTLFVIVLMPCICSQTNTAITQKQHDPLVRALICFKRMCASVCVWAAQNHKMREYIWKCKYCVYTIKCTHHACITHNKIFMKGSLCIAH
jgi:hypothetical protein